MSLVFNMVGGGSGGGSDTYAFIIVTYPAGSTCTASNGTKTLTAPDTSGSVVFDIPTPSSTPESWTVTATDGVNTATETVSITYDGQSESVNLAYWGGIKRIYNSSDPAWTREGAYENFTATASVGTVAGRSDFDNVYPWSDIERVTLETGDVMIKIPKFAYWRFRDSDNYEHLRFASGAGGDFAWHPAFLHNGATTPQDYIYVGAYKTSSNNKSVSGASPTVSQTRAAMRTNAAAKGTGWGIIDLSAISAILMLIMVEFATNDVQSVIGAGYTNGSAKINTGSCNNVPNLTGRPAGTSNLVDVVWRGIEGLWGNVWEWFDGLNWNGGTYWACNNQADYADDTSTGYTSLSYTGGATNWSTSYIKEMGYDADAAAYMLPTIGGGSNSSYYCDAVSSSTGWRVALHGGSNDNGTSAGLFALLMSLAASGASAGTGSRLLYIPS